ncbi:MAG: hypothetical protein QF724_09600 [Planctomycetota bacterium]|nr:hypothetical protein [Planctomycetota bacterium]MDP6839178.1 hypothetical protein [Planctomycetota bacterium]MDP6954731.1 hypothetical protein [Planctomycetota bacterium]
MTPSGSTAPQPPQPAKSPRRRPPRGLGRLAAYLVGPAYLAAAALGLSLVFGGDSRLFGWALGALFGVLLVWLTISIFYPTAGQPPCPACSEDRTEPLDPQTTRGIKCGACGFVDEEASSFYHAEESGSLITIVRREAGLPDAPPNTGATDTPSPPVQEQP